MNRIGQLQSRLSDHIHRPGDEHADRAGWSITTTTGLCGFGARVYRDPRFDLRLAPAGATGDAEQAAADSRDRGGCTSDDHAPDATGGQFDQQKPGSHGLTLGQASTERRRPRARAVRERDRVAAGSYVQASA
jgi:hypothetical protein